MTDSIKISVKKSVYTDIQDIIKEYVPSNQTELEFRLGRNIDGRFSPGVTKEEFDQVQKYLMADEKYESCQTEDIIDIYQNGVRSTPGGGYMKKTKQKNLTLPNINSHALRLTLSDEISSTKPENINVIFTRSRKRISFTDNEKTYRIDITEVKQRDSNIYEIEVEYLKKPTNIKKLFDPIKLILLISKSEFDQQIVENFNKLISGEKYSSSKPLLEFNKQRNIKRDLIPKLHKNYGVYPKLDGVRYFLYLDPKGGYLIGSQTTKKVIESIPEEFSGTILDGEKLDKGYYVFDILFLNKQDLRHLPLRARLIELENLDKSFPKFKLSLPLTGNIYEDTKKLLKEKNEHPVDGLIFTPLDGPYRNVDTHKYKPVEMLTIDFAIFKSDKPGRAYKMKVYDNEKKLIKFVGTEKYPFSGITRLTEEDELKFGGNDGTILEFKWINNQFDPVRKRDDKTLPNYVNIAQDVWEDINDPITQDELLELLKPKEIENEFKKKNPIVKTKVKMTHKNVKMLEPNTTYTFTSPFEDDLVRTGTLYDGSCLFHSVLHAYSPKYRKMAAPERSRYVEDLRETLAKQLTKERWETFGEGLVAKVPVQEKIQDLLKEFYEFLDDPEDFLNKTEPHFPIIQVMKQVIGEDIKVKIYKLISEIIPLTIFEKKILPTSFENSKDKTVGKCAPFVIDEATQYCEKYLSKISGLESRKKAIYIQSLQKLIGEIMEVAEMDAFEEFKRSLSDPNEWVGQDLMGYISDVFKRDIYFINASTRLPYQVGGSLEYKKRKSIVILWIEGGHYEILGKRNGKKVQRDFASDDDFIQKLYTFLCEPEKAKDNYPNLVEYLPKQYQ
jgi:hypothetical protein